MDERKRNILIIAATTAAVVLMVVANIAFILMHPAGTEDQDKAAASDVKAETSTSTPAVRHQKPLRYARSSPRRPPPHTPPRTPTAAGSSNDTSHPTRRAWTSPSTESPTSPTYRHPAA